MKDSFGMRVRKAWNAFFNNRDPTEYYNALEPGSIISTSKPDRLRLTGGNERSIITAVYNRIAMDAAAISIQHVRLDEENRYTETIDSPLNECLSLQANIDQTGRAFLQDVVLSMLDEGCVAIVPVETSVDPTMTNSYEIFSMRTAKILEWRPNAVRLKIYNDRLGKKEEIILPKSCVAIIENPFYAVMNEPSSTMKRLSRKLSLLDMTDENNSSGKLDLIIQLPYVIKTQARKEQADNRRKEIENQLKESKYGIAYTDGTEKITQLNRSLENNLQAQVEYLTSMLYSQLGISQEILDGTATEETMLNYYNRTIEPIISAITDELKRKFLTKTARTEHQSIMFFRDPFKLVPIGKLADLADRFTRNEIMTSNEIRQVVGMKPSLDPEADILRNKNLNGPEVGYAQDPTIQNEPIEEGYEVV